jgi:predicted RNA binding protein YcfA (HicA-like mRNA interferase family)
MPIEWSKIRGISAKALTNALIKDDFYLKAQKGSHHRYYHPDGRRVTVAYHYPNETFCLKTLKAMIEEQTRWSDEDLRRLNLMS